MTNDASPSREDQWCKAAADARRKMTAAELREALKDPAYIAHAWDPNFTKAQALEFGYQRVVAAFVAPTWDVALLQEAVGIFASVITNTSDPISLRLQALGFELYARMHLNYAQRGTAAERAWPDDVAKTCIDVLEQLLSDEKNDGDSRSLDAKFTLWQSALMSVKKVGRQRLPREVFENLLGLRERVWRNLLNTRPPASHWTAQHYEHAILLRAWMAFLAGDRQTGLEVLSIAEAGIRGGFRYPELESLLVLVCESIPDPPYEP